MRIRQAEEKDAEAIRAIYNAEVLSSTATTDLVPRSEQANAAFVAEHRGVYPLIVADELGEVLGFACLSPYRSRPAYSTTTENSIYVATGARGKGVGTVLLTELVGLARAHGFHSVIARVVTEQAASIALHERVGFARVGIERQVARKFGRWLDVCLMQLLLAERPVRDH